MSTYSCNGEGRVPTADIDVLGLPERTGQLKHTLFVRDALTGVK